MPKFNIKAVFLPFVFLIPIVSLLILIILQPHLRYAFADVDWVFLLSFKQLSSQSHDPLNHLINAYRTWGVYTYQVYYIGLIEKFFGMDYRNFQIVTHIFKIIATLSIYFFIYLITKSRLAAFLTSVIYAVAYPSVGVMYTVVTSGLYVAIPVMSLFFVWYWYLVNKGRNGILDIIIGVILFFTTIILSTERMYPLVPTVILIEFYWCFRNGYSKKILLQTVKRLSAFILVLLVIFLYKPSAFTVLSGNSLVTYQKFVMGNWQVVLSPLISLGSLFISRDYWQIFGVPNIDSLSSYMSYFISKPLIIFTCLTILLSFFLAKKRLEFILQILILNFGLAITVYIMASHHLHIAQSLQMHFDPTYIIPILIGVYVISLSLVLFKVWLDGEKKDSLLISMIGGMSIAFIFILLTWVAADWILVFSGVHRYLTLPAIGSSLFIAGAITLIFRKLNNNNHTKKISYLIFLILIPIIIFNASVTSGYFNYELKYVGTDAEEHIRMKSKLWSYLGNFSKTDPSIFYFDESADHDNGYFDETTVMAGFGYWMRFRGEEIVDAKLTPTLLRSNLICSEPGSMCLGKVKELVMEKNGIKGIMYGDTFYKSENFYAFRFINKDIVDITPEIVKTIGLE